MYIPNSRLLRGILRITDVFQHASSYPFLSGDTYRQLCDFEIKDNFANFFNSLSSNRKVFLSVENFKSMINWIMSQSNLPRRKEILVVHNGDRIPSFTEYNFVSDFFEKIYSVNWLGNNSRVKSLPIGLENLSYVRNGVPLDFTSKDLSFNAWRNRPIKLLVSFTDSTNIDERVKARYFSQNLRDTVVVKHNLRPNQYQRLIRNSKFVLSPPGNGPDCHRTWESIYLGAIPIVIRKAWQFNEIEENVIVLDSWDQLGEIEKSTKLPMLNPIKKLHDLYLAEFIS